MMKKKQKKILKWVGIAFGILVILLLAIPLFLESRMGDLIRTNVNKNIRAEFDFRDADLSLLSSFPNAELTFQDAHIINIAPFEGDTLFRARDVGMTIGLGELFKGAGEPIGIRRLTIDGAAMQITVDEEGRASYDIAMETPGDSTAADGFNFELQHYEIRDSRISYIDRETGIGLLVDKIEHQGDGDLSLTDTELDTYTEALVSFQMDSVQYLDANPVALEALIGINLETLRYTFLENSGRVNDLPLVFDGYVQVYEAYQDVQLNFRTPSSDFRNFLAVIPQAYRGNLDNVETQGDFMVVGELSGRSDDTYIPKMDIQITSDNASFKFPQLPKQVSGIKIDATVKNTSGLPEETFVSVDEAAFRIGEDRFRMTALISELLGNTRVKADVDANMQLANLAEAYPMPQQFNMAGKLVADLQTEFTMEAVEKKRYQDTRTQGNLQLDNFRYKPEALPNELMLDRVVMDFTPARVNLRSLKGKTGRSDFGASGSISNLLGYMFSDEPIKGAFTLESGVFDLADFMPRETTSPPEAGVGAGKAETGSMKIPGFLDCTIDARAATVYYDGLELTGLKGQLKLSEQTATLEGLTASMLGGNVNLTGQVNTQRSIPEFKVKLDLKSFSISKAVQQLDLMAALAPIAEALDGTFSSNLELNGQLDGDLAPELPSLSGKALAEVVTSQIDPAKQRYLALLDEKLNFIDLDSIDLKGLKTYLTFDSGKVQVRPFDIRYKDFLVKVEGSHGFNTNLDYKATLEVPAKYLGAEVNTLLKKLNDPQAEKISIPVVATIGGTFQSPSVSTDLASGVRSLTNQLVEIQKQRAKEQGTEKAKDLLGGLLGKKDSTRKDSATGRTVGETLGKVLGKPKDSVVTDTSKAQGGAVEDAARKVLGNILKKKKKDSVNQ